MNKGLSIRLVLFIGLSAGIILAVVYRDSFDIDALQAWVRDAGILAPVAFMTIYALATVFFLPGSVITLAGGALFGPVLGTFYNLTGATIGATLAFLISRYLASDWVADRAGGRVKQIINGVEGEGWRFVAFVRLVPLFPFNLLNYALGLTKIPLMQYVLASYIFMLPGGLAYTYIGYAGREAIGGGEGLLQKILIGLALFAIVAFLPRLISRIRKGPTIDIPELKRRIDTDSTLVLDVRTEVDFAGEQGHIASALNISLEELAGRMDEIADHKAKPVAIVCRTDRRSAKAALMLAKQGFHNVHVVDGGMTKWNEAGLPVEH